jgi:hypothetical protein
MMKKKRSDELDAALRAEPDYQELRALLSKQTEEQKRRFSQTFAEEGSMSSSEEITARILRLKDEGLTYQQIAERLNAEGFRTARGGDFTRTNVQQYVLRSGKQQAKRPELAKGGEAFATDESERDLAKPGEPFAEEKVEPELAKRGEACEAGEAGEAANLRKGGEESEAAKPDESVAEETPKDEVALVGEPCEDSDARDLRKADEFIARLEAGRESDMIPDQWLTTIRELIREEISYMQVTTEARNDIRKTSEQPPIVPRKPGARGLAGERETLPGCRVDGILYDLFVRQRENEGISASDLMSKILWLYYDQPLLTYQGAEREKKDSQPGKTDAGQCEEKATTLE